LQHLPRPLLIAVLRQGQLLALVAVMVLVVLGEANLGINHP